jgi:uncharacterized protein DUF3311
MRWRAAYYPAAALIVLPFLVYFAIPTYNMDSPELGGVPFFYWWQTLWLVISAGLFAGAAWIIESGG